MNEKMRFKGVVGELQILPALVSKYNKNSESGIYVVAFAGYADSLKEFHVQINLGSNGYSSDWPEWAYNLAKEALMSNKRLWVISKGVPYGANLQQVLIYNF